MSILLLISNAGGGEKQFEVEINISDQHIM
jgi:hypothetical protein